MVVVVGVEGVDFGVAEREEVRLRGDWPTTAEIETIIASAPRMIRVRFINYFCVIRINAFTKVEMIFDTRLEHKR